MTRWQHRGRETYGQGGARARPSGRCIECTSVGALDQKCESLHGVSLSGPGRTGNCGCTPAPTGEVHRTDASRASSKPRLERKRYSSSSTLRVSPPCGAPHASFSTKRKSSTCCSTTRKGHRISFLCGAEGSPAVSCGRRWTSSLRTASTCSGARTSWVSPTEGPLPPSSQKFAHSRRPLAAH